MSFNISGFFQPLNCYKIFLKGWKMKMKWKLLIRVWLCDPMDYTVHGILQARILEWGAFPLSRRSSQPRGCTQVSHIAGGFFTSWATREASTKIIYQYCVWKNVSHLGTSLAVPGLSLLVANAEELNPGQELRLHMLCGVAKIYIYISKFTS